MEDDLRPGRILGPYELILPVGIGGMARVWAARVRGTGQIVALKMLLPQLAENPSFQEMFFDEARIASRIRHPNVAQTYELGSYDGVLTLVMEWVDGGSLVRLLRPGPEQDENRPRIPLPYRHAARILADAAAGLHAAHETVDESGRPLGVVHRDVSPHNVLITTSGEIKVTDFGVAKALNKSHVTIAGQIKGKLAYMSPEQLMGSGVDRRSDVFALGCVLYEATTGERPFRGDHDPQVMAAIMIGQYEPPQAFRPDYPLELAEIVARCLDGDSDRRFPTADHLRAALEQYLRNSGPPITPQQIAVLQEERIGPELHGRAHALGPAAPASAPMSRDTASAAGAMSVERRGAASPRSAGLVGLTLAVLVGAGLGAGVLAYVRTTMKNKNKAPTVAASASSSAAPVEPPPLVPEALVVDAAVPEDVSLDDELDAASTIDASASASDAGDDAIAAAAPRPKPKPPPKEDTDTGAPPPDLPPNPFE